jgi:hypothetical protein
MSDSKTPEALRIIARQMDNAETFRTDELGIEAACLRDSADEIERLRKALATYACRCGDCECYVDEFVPSCGRSARVALEDEGKR